jgi:hypothetical protein
MIRIESRVPLLEDILEPWRAVIGADHDRYRGHVYRMLHCCLALHPATAEERDRLIIAAVHHDIGLWTADTLDYLPPSIACARAWLEANGRTEWGDEIALIIAEHHKLTPYRGPGGPLVEVFRRGDLADVSLGLLASGLPAAFLRDLRAAFPNLGFHRMLLRRAGGWFLRHPLNSAPFARW